MQFVAPIPLREALDKLGDKTLVASRLDTEEWRRTVPLALRDRAYFSSQVESLRVLQRGRDSVLDFLAGNRETLDNGAVALKTGSRADFVKQMQAFLEGEGIERTTGGLTDIASERRLGLIFDTQVRQAQDFGHWKQGQDPDVLDAFPAQRFIRVQDVSEARDAHTRFEGEVRLKSDTGFWSAINEDFGVPWGPWGWGCGHDVEDVDRGEAEALGLLEPGQAVQPVARDFNDGLQASLRGLDADMVERLRENFGDQVLTEEGSIRWLGQPTEPRTEAERILSRPQVEAVINYTGEGYKALNHALREQGAEAPLADRRAADRLSHALLKLPKHEGTVYRGAFLEQPDVARYLPGNIVTERAFTSTTADPARIFLGNAQFSIESKTGRDVTKLSSAPNEREVLFNQGARFQVLAREFRNGEWHIRLQEL
jgi:hypothetical protein